MADTTNLRFLRSNCGRDRGAPVVPVLATPEDGSVVVRYENGGREKGREISRVG